MAELVIETPEGVTLRSEIAGAGTRTAAGLIDATIYVFIWVTTLFGVMIAASIDPTGASAFVYGLFATGIFLGSVVYHTAIPVFWGGRTPGKSLLGIRAVDAEGYPASFRQHFLRALFWSFEVLLMVPIPLGVILIASTERHQRLGDRVAGTVVLRDPTASAAGEPYPRDRWSKLKNRRLPLTPALTARFDGDDLTFLRSLFTRHDMEQYARDKLFKKSARHYARVLGMDLDVRLSSEEAVELLRELYVFLREMRGAHSVGG